MKFLGLSLYTLVCILNKVSQKSQDCGCYISSPEDALRWGLHLIYASIRKSRQIIKKQCHKYSENFFKNQKLHDDVDLEYKPAC